MGLARRVAAGLLAGGLAACTYSGSGIDNPFKRKVVWFSFLNGDDIRPTCQPGAPERLRLVFNGKWAEQVRIYELGAGDPRQLDQRVIEFGTVTALTLSDPLAPWRGKAAQTRLTDAQYAGLMAALDDSGAFRPLDRSLWLPSDDFYWVAVSCHQGHFNRTAWWYGPDPSLRVPFVAPLLALDTTGVAYNTPHDPDSADFADKPRADRQRWYYNISADEP